MSFKVIATPLRSAPIDFSLELEALAPLGVTIAASAADSDSAFIAEAHDADVILSGAGRRLTAEIIQHLARTRLITSPGVGVDRIDVDAATRQGILVTNVPDVYLEEVAVHAIMLLLCCAKKTIPLDRAIRTGHWAEARSYLRPMPRVVGDTLGLVAFGNIPRLVARKAHAFDMHVLAWDPFVSDDVFASAGVERVTDLDDVFRRADFVSAHLPLTSQTRGLLTYAQFSQMQPTAYFIDTGRGPTHVEADLIRALQEGKLAGAGLDVMEQEPTPADSPLHHMDNVVLTPHSASVSDWGQRMVRRRVGEQVAALVRGHVPRAVVNPEVLQRMDLRPA